MEKVENVEKKEREYYEKIMNEEPFAQFFEKIRLTQIAERDKAALQKEKRLKYNFKTKHLTARISEDLFCLIHDSCKELQCSRQDLVVASLLAYLDPTEQCPDYKLLNYRLR